MKNLVLFLLFLLAVNASFAQLNVVKFEQIDSLQNIQKRKVIVFIHTDWCKYCQAMKNTTFKNNEVIKTVNNNFYFIDFNAEEKNSIVFNETTFKYKPTGTTSGVHQLALKLGTINKQISYPTLCVLNEKNEIIFQQSNFLNAKDLKFILNKIE